MTFVRADPTKLAKEDRDEYNRLLSKKKNSYQGGQILSDQEEMKFEELYEKATAAAAGAGGGVSKQSKKRPTARLLRSSKSRKSRKARTTRRR